jgi:ribosomal protein L30E
MAEKLQRKEVKINTGALGLVLKATIKVVEKINQDLIIISSEMGRMSDSSVKQFITGLSWFKIV